MRAAVRTQSPPRILDTLTERRATFSRGDLNRVLAKVITDPKERAALTDRILALPDVIGLKETAEAPVSRYTTRAVLQDEGRILEDAAALAAKAAVRDHATGKLDRCCDITRRSPGIGTPPFAGLWRPTDLP